MINMKKQIGNISQIRFGYYTQPEEIGSVNYLQARQFDDLGMLINLSYEYINIDQKSEPHLLKDGDVLFVGKGSRLFAWCYRKQFGSAVASSIFFVITPDTSIVYPEYLAAILNLPQTKNIFEQIGAGTNILSIRKSELEAFEVPILPMAEQEKIAAMYHLYRRDIVLHRELKEQKDNLYKATISKLIK